VFGRKTIESDAAIWISLAVRSVQPGLGGLKQARLTVAQGTICLANKRHEEHIIEPAEEQLFQIRQGSSWSGIAGISATRWPKSRGPLKSNPCTPKARELCVWSTTFTSTLPSA